MSAIVVEGLRKRYGDREVLHGIDLVVEPGEVVAVLGPNGAGKTTTVEILEGLQPRDAGSVRVLGEDPWRAGTGFRERVGVVLQQGSPEPFVSVRELVELHRSFYERALPADQLLALVDLTEHARKRVRTLSGGQQRRLDIALALVGDPELLFLDEPTTGFDPEARLRAWDMIRTFRELGKTIVLTTHYLDEAAALADRIVVLAGGRVVAERTPPKRSNRPDPLTTWYLEVTA